MRSFHFAGAAILAQVTGFGKNVVPLFGFWIGHGFLLIGPQLMEGLRKNWSLRFGCKFGGGCFHGGIRAGGIRRFHYIAMLRFVVGCFGNVFYGRLWKP